MSTLLKAASVQLGVERKSLLSSAPIRGDLAPDAVAPLSAMASSDTAACRLMDLEQSYRALEQSLEARERAAFDEGQQAGLREGHARATRQYDAQRDAVRAGLAQAQEAFQQRLRKVETLAIDMTQAVLDRLFGDPALQQALVMQTIQHHLADLSAEAVIRLHVSRDDFPDTETASAAWLALTRHGQRDVRSTPALPAGACTIELTLGRLDVGLSQQHGRATATLDELRRHA